MVSKKIWPWIVLGILVLAYIGSSGDSEDAKQPPTGAESASITQPTELPGSAAEAVANGQLTMADIKHRAEAIGWSTTAWQEWYYVANKTGTTMEAIEEAAQNINQKLAAEDPGFVAAMEEVGISLAEAKQMEPEELFDKVIYGLQGQQSAPETAESRE